MFVQVIKGKTNDIDALNALGERWQQEVRPNAVGYAGGTFGVAADGTFVVIAQFTDDVSAKENSGRPEQDAWYQDFIKVLDGEPTFRESADTSLLFEGPSEKAGFVQVMESTVKDRAKAEAMETDEMLAELRKARPDLLGGLRVWLSDGQVVEVAYFTSEADARKGESSGEFEAPHEDFASMYENMTYVDLLNPQVHTA
jgi:hypothetical protein